jgi:hypothetical protein
MNGIDYLNELSTNMQQHWLREVAELDNPIDYLTSQYDELEHFLGIFDWSGSIMGYSFWSEYYNNIVNEANHEIALNKYENGKSNN